MPTLRDDPEAWARAVAQALGPLSTLHGHLGLREFVAGERLGVADVALDGTNVLMDVPERRAGYKARGAHAG